MGTNHYPRKRGRMITLERKRQQSLITQLMRADYFYGTMYGMPKDKDKIIKIETRNIHNFVFDWNGKGPGIIYLWGWPGPDGNVYLLSDRMQMYFPTLDLTDFYSQ